MERGRICNINMESCGAAGSGGNRALARIEREQTEKPSKAKLWKKDILFEMANL